jgi:hypothetical protein
MAVVFLVGNVLPHWRNIPSNFLVLAAREFNSKAAKAIWDLNGKPGFETTTTKHSTQDCI